MLHTAVRVAITTVGDCLAVFKKDRRPTYPLNVKSQWSKPLPSAFGSGFPTLMSSGRGFDTDCPIVLTASASPCLMTVDAFQYLCRELVKLASQHLDFLSRCHRHSISQNNIKNKSISQFQEYLLRHHARVGNDAKRVQSALYTRMRIVFSRIRLELKTSV